MMLELPIHIHKKKATPNSNQQNDNKYLVWIPADTLESLHQLSPKFLYINIDI